jgi:hypothetical protein
MGKHKRHCFNTSQLTVDCEATAGFWLAWLQIQGRTYTMHGYRVMLYGYSTWKSKVTFFSWQ